MQLRDFIFNQVFCSNRFTKARVRILQDRFSRIVWAVPARERVLANYVKNTLEETARGNISLNAMIKRLGYVKATLEGM